MFGNCSQPVHSLPLYDWPSVSVPSDCENNQFLESNESLHQLKIGLNRRTAP